MITPFFYNLLYSVPPGTQIIPKSDQGLVKNLNFFAKKIFLPPELISESFIASMTFDAYMFGSLVLVLLEEEGGRKKEEGGKKKEDGEEIDFSEFF
jgi:hypothetical protein